MASGSKGRNNRMSKVVENRGLGEAERIRLVGRATEARVAW